MDAKKIANEDVGMECQEKHHQDGMTEYEHTVPDHIGQDDKQKQVVTEMDTGDDIGDDDDDFEKDEPIKIYMTKQFE